MLRHAAVISAPGRLPHDFTKGNEDVNGLSRHSGTLHCGTTGTKNSDADPLVPRRQAVLQRQRVDGGRGDVDRAVDHGFSIILDVAMGGSYPDNTCHCSAPEGTTTAGGTLSVRSLAVYSGVPG